jgi:WhiB family redox-sensing transcriptional regulator
MTIIDARLLRPVVEHRFRHDPDAMAWASRAGCADEDPELFFPLGNGPDARRRELAAKRVCRACPVRGECLEWALTTFQDAGVWGGLGEEERREIRRARRRGGASDGLSLVR